MNRQHYVQDLERRFLSRPRRRPSAVAEKLGQVEELGGVYGIWQHGKLRYFGETCHLNHRIFEIVVIGRHHSLNLLMGNKALGKTGREKSAWLRRSTFRVSWMVVEIGRSELEEYMVLKYAADLKNHQGGRFSLRSDIAEWREIIEEPNPKIAAKRGRQSHSVRNGHARI
jgi:hypothetical protein